MSVSPNELDAFYQFASQRLGDGIPPTQLEDVLTAFRRQGDMDQSTEGAAHLDVPSPAESDSKWSERLRRWADSFPMRANIVDDSREGIYRDNP